MRIPRRSKEIELEATLPKIYLPHIANSINRSVFESSLRSAYSRTLELAVVRSHTNSKRLLSDTQLLEHNQTTNVYLILIGSTSVVLRLWKVGKFLRILATLVPFNRTFDQYSRRKMKKKRRRKLAPFFF